MSEEKYHKDSASIYRSSYYQILKIKSEKKQLRFLKAIFEYEFDGTEIPEDLLKDGMIELIWMSIQPLIDNRVKNYRNGCKGGAPSGNKNAIKQPKNNPKSTHKQPKNNRKQPKDKEKDKENDNDNVNYHSPTESALGGDSLSNEVVEEQEDDWDWDWSKVPDPKDEGNK